MSTPTWFKQPFESTFDEEYKHRVNEIILDAVRHTGFRLYWVEVSEEISELYEEVNDHFMNGVTPEEFNKWLYPLIVDDVLFLPFNKDGEFEQ
ncbi:hypothetical protein [Pasteurella phage vB_PmuP_Pa7]|uniref:Uncharacterized protein n=1 Tax=Pasteurella phage vB_PmuP_Pa7 TaxID=2767198 RepID=A0A7G8ZYQ8_9CAUD|nr:hypothetical protein [Pasteurella phage vB_PmuP_Pa7]